MSSWSNFYLYDRAFEVMEIDLARGLETAYCLFIEMDWLRLLSNVWAISYISDPQFIPLRGYIRGLSSVKSDTAQQEFLDHLHEPRNLTLTFLMTTTDYFSYSNDYDQTEVDTQMSCLMNLWPTHPSWIKCKATAQVLLAWVESPDRDTAQFPLADLINGHLALYSPTHVLSEGLHKQIHMRLERGLHLLDNNLRGVEPEQ
ncbi:hypothetical protein BDZ89DRAFT_1069988 [Hymenopellis radicata]|nr:hypothetical protein BDZ89DRAFT_1069988 [Hymenopellis radicata]